MTTVKKSLGHAVSVLTGCLYPVRARKIQINVVITSSS